MKIQDVISSIEQVAPTSYQESYDNVGLIVGEYETKLSGVLICIDVIERVVEEAIQKKANLIISHHPVVFKGLKKFNGATDVERSVIKAIQNKIAIYAAHTNIDSVRGGVNERICEMLDLKNRRILAPVENDIYKLVSFVPMAQAPKLREALFHAGAGRMGNYNSCSFNIQGQGSFKAEENANPYVGEKGKIHYENEVRIETIFPKHLTKKLVNVLRDVHPYEEPAYDIYALQQENKYAGLGMLGELETEENSIEVLQKIKKTFNCKCVKHSPIVKSKIKKIAVCGGSGSTLIKNAIVAKADLFITGDVKYHEFFSAENQLIIADIGHYESEQFTQNIFYEIVLKKIPKFAVHFSEINTNPINYL